MMHGPDADEVWRCPHVALDIAQCSTHTQLVEQIWNKISNERHDCFLYRHFTALRDTPWNKYAASLTEHNNAVLASWPAVRCQNCRQGHLMVTVRPPRNNRRNLLVHCSHYAQAPCRNQISNHSHWIPASKRARDDGDDDDRPIRPPRREQSIEDAVQALSDALDAPSYTESGDDMTCLAARLARNALLAPLPPPRFCELAVPAPHAPVLNDDFVQLVARAVREATVAPYESCYPAAPSRCEATVQPSC
jgi:hypothetical protein